MTVLNNSNRVRFRFYKNDMEHLVEARVDQDEIVEIVRVVNEDGAELEDVHFDGDTRRDIEEHAVLAVSFPTARPVFFPDEIDTCRMWLKEQMEAEDSAGLLAAEFQGKAEEARLNKEWAKREIHYLEEMAAAAVKV